MRLEFSRYTERVGAVRLHEVMRVIELDSSGGGPELPTLAVRRVSEERLLEHMARMAVVIPIRDERLKVFEGLLSAIPHACALIVVSNSKRAPVDRFRLERDVLDQFCYYTQRRALIVHQQSPLLARILQEIGYAALLDAEGRVRDGKAEGMLIGMLLAHTIGKDFVGFVDADNYFPGSVYEYVRIFAAGFSLSPDPEYAMVRILWRYKPKLTYASGLRLDRWGRVSERTNRYLNRLLSLHTDFTTDIIRTANSGEHALSLRLAQLIPYASGYGIEPYQIVALLEHFGSSQASEGLKQLGDHLIDVLQIESRNPHLHENKGLPHIQSMTLQSLSTLYHSSLADEAFRMELREELIEEGLLGPDEEIPVPHILPPFGPYAEAFRNRVELLLEQAWLPARWTWPAS